MHLLTEHDLTAKNVRPFSREQRWRLIRAGKFPKPLKIGARNYWIENEVDEWMASLVANALVARATQSEVAA